MAKAAREYAKALYNSLKSTEEKKVSHEILKQLNNALKQDSSLMNQIKAKSINVENTKKTFAVLLDSLKTPETLKSFFYLLIDKGRIELVNDLSLEFQKLVDLESGVLRGLVKSARPIDSDSKSRLEEKFSKKMDKKVILTYQQDLKVVAGVKVEIGAFTFDDTIETHIKKIKENLNRSWS